MLDVGETAEAFAYGLIPGYTIGNFTYRYYTEGDPISNEEVVGGITSFLLQTYLVNKLGFTGIGSRAGLFLMTAGETMAELKYLFPRTFAVASRALPVATLGMAAAYGRGTRKAMTRVTEMYADAGVIDIGHGKRSGWSQMKSPSRALGNQR